MRLYGSNFELADAVAVFQPFFQYTRDALPDIPLWNPHLMGGRPYLADAQSAILSPFTAPAYVLPLWKSLAVMAALKLFVASFGTFLFARSIGLRYGGALFAGVVFAFGTFFVVWLAWPLTNIFPLIPWMLLVCELLIRRPGPLPVAALAALVGLQFLGGHPETSFHVMVVTTLWFAFRALLAWHRGGRERSALTHPAAAYAAAVLLGTALAALMLLPLMEFFVHSGDYERRLNRPASYSSSRFLGAFFLSDYWGRPTQTAIAPFVSNRGYYAGGITLMLASVGARAQAHAHPRGDRSSSPCSRCWSCSAPGRSPTSCSRCPGFRTAHNGRMVIFVLLALALLAGWGLDELTGRERAAPARRRAALGVAAAIFPFPFAWLVVAGTIDLGVLKPAMKVAWALRDPPQAATLAELAGVAPIVRLSALLQWLVLAGAGLLRGRGGAGLPAPRARTRGGAGRARHRHRRRRPVPRQHGLQPGHPDRRWRCSRPPARSATCRTARRSASSGWAQPGEQQALGVDLAMRYGLYDARGYDFPVEKRYDKLWRAEVGPPGEVVPPTAFALPTERALRTLDLFSVADVMQDPTLEPLRLPGLRLAYDGDDARVYSNSNALPRAFLVGGQQTVDGEDAALAAITDPAIDKRRVAVTEQSLPGLAQGAPAGGAPGTARLVSYGRDEAVARVEARRPALLVVTDVWFPGWKAKVDGRDADVERVDYLLRGVSVPAGAHTVELSYEPASWRVGWIVSLLALLADRRPGRRGRQAAPGMNALRSLRRRPVLAAALIYAALSLLMVGPALLPGKTLSNSDMFWFQPPWVGVKPAELTLPSNPELGDAPGQLQPFLRYGARRIPDMPLWDPYIVGGRPFLANAQSAVFSIYSLPAYVLPFWTALSWIAVMKLFVASFGMFLLGRVALGMRFGGALTAGIVYAFSLWMVTWISYPHMSVWTFIPWMLLLTDRLVRRPSLLAGAGLTAVIGMQLLAGHPESSFHALLATAAFLLLRLWQAHRAGSAVLRPLLGFAAATAGGVALAALVIVPFAELLWNSADLRDRMGDAVDNQPVARDFALGLFLPDYWGRATGHPDQVLRARPRLLRRGAAADAGRDRADPQALARADRGGRVRGALAGGAVRHPALSADRHPAAGLLLRSQQPPERAVRGRARDPGRLGPRRADSRRLDAAHAPAGARRGGGPRPAARGLRRGRRPHHSERVRRRPEGGLGLRHAAGRDAQLDRRAHLRGPLPARRRRDPARRRCWSGLSSRRQPWA